MAAVARANSAGLAYSPRFVAIPRNKVRDSSESSVPPDTNLGSVQVSPDLYSTAYTRVTLGFGAILPVSFMSADHFAKNISLGNFARLGAGVQSTVDWSVSETKPPTETERPLVSEICRLVTLWIHYYR